MAVTDHTHETVAVDGQATDDLEERDIRALLSPMTVIDDCGAVRGAEGLYEVTTDSGSEYLVDIEQETCTCPDFEYRDVRCKHIRRVAFETGREAIPAWVDLATVDDQLGEHITEGEPRIAVADGGTIPRRDFESGGAGRDLETERVDGGVLVFDSSIEKPGRKLAGFAAVDDWDAIRSELARRGHDVGAIHHLEEYDADEVLGA